MRIAEGEPRMPLPLHFRTTIAWRARALGLLGLLALGMALAACGRCGDFWPSSQSQIGACHSDPPRQ
jgi:hypothetical protein